MKRARIDWQQARARIEAGERALNASLSETPERIEAAFRKRAQRLAEVVQTRTVAALPILIFALGRERYAVELAEVTEVLPYTPCTPLPGARAQLLGVINVRGEPRIVLDLSRTLAVSGAARSEAGFVLMVRAMGWKVDRIEGLRAVSLEEMTASPAGGCGKALVGGTLPLLDVDRVLAASIPKGNLNE